MKKVLFNQKIRWSAYVYLAFFLFITSLILYLALQPADVSNEQSGLLVTLIEQGLIIFNVHLDETSLGQLTLLVRKLIGHFGLFFVDGLFAYLSFNSLFKANKGKLLIITISVIILIAVISELLQNLAIGRAMQVSDMMIDISGGILGITIVYFIEYAILKKKEKV